MPLDISQETLLQITAGCALIVALLRLATAFLTTAMKAKLRLRLACFAVSVSLEVGRLGLREGANEAASEEKERSSDG